MKLSTLFRAFVKTNYELDKVSGKLDESDETDDVKESELYEKWHKLMRQQSAFRRAVQKRISLIETGA